MRLRASIAEDIFLHSSLMRLDHESWSSIIKPNDVACSTLQIDHRAELCNTSGILTGAMALNLKDRDDKGHDTIKKNDEIGKYPAAFYSFTA